MNHTDTFPTALLPPQQNITCINTDILQKAIDSSRQSPRKRIILPFHKSESDNLHRMLNALQPMSYIRPHRHIDPPKAESIIVLKGAIRCVIFDNLGNITEHYNLAAASFNIGIDTEPGIYHTFFATVPDTVLFEVKPGPYEKSSDKDFASWAPTEHSEGVESYLKALYEQSER